MCSYRAIMTDLLRNCRISKALSQKSAGSRPGRASQLSSDGSVHVRFDQGGFALWDAERANPCPGEGTDRGTVVTDGATTAWTRVGGHFGSPAGAPISQAGMVRAAPPSGRWPRSSTQIPVSLRTQDTSCPGRAARATRCGQDACIPAAVRTAGRGMAGLLSLDRLGSPTFALRRGCGSRVRCRLAAWVAGHCLQFARLSVWVIRYPDGCSPSPHLLVSSSRLPARMLTSRRWPHSQQRAQTNVALIDRPDLLDQLEDGCGRWLVSRVLDGPSRRAGW